MNNKGVVLQIVRELHSTGVIELQLLAGGLPDPARNFYFADIISLPVMGTGLGKEHSVTMLQPVNGTCPSHHLFQIPFVPGKQDGEGGQRKVFWRICCSLQEYL
ncbi:hypothetical protein D3C75_1163490 [compost metagenome]